MTAGRAAAAERLRVLIVVESLALGGTERVTVDLANLLVRAGHSVDLVHGFPADALAPEVDPAVDVHSLGRTTRRHDARAVLQLARLLDRRRPDLLHAMGRAATSLSWSGRAVSRVGTPIVFHDHTSWTGDPPPVGAILRTAVRFGVRWYIGVDERLCDWARRSLTPLDGRVALVSNPVRDELFEAVEPDGAIAALGPTADPITLVMIANLRPPKNHEGMIRAIAASPEAARLRLVVVGEATGPGRAACDQLARQLGVHEQVHFIGPRRDVAPVLAAADVGVLSSSAESGPIAVLEYLAAGLPVVATATGEVARAAAAAGIGNFVPPDDIGALADALTRLARQSPEERRAAGAQGRQFVGAEFGTSQYLERILRIYADTLSAPTSVGGRH